MYEYEDIPEKEVKNYAQQIGALFHTTSAKDSKGIDELFIAIGEKLVDPNGELSKELDKKSDAVSLNQRSAHNMADNAKNSGCC